MNLLNTVARYLGYTVMVSAGLLVWLMVCERIDRRVSAWRYRRQLERYERASIEYEVERVIRESQIA